MRALTARQKIFVIAVLDLGIKENLKAARVAGYEGTDNTVKVTGHWLAHNPRVVAALKEGARTRFEMGTVAAARLVLDTVDDETIERKDRLKAAAMVLDRGGMPATTEHRVNVRHELTREEKVLRLAELAIAAGEDPRQLLGTLSDVIEGDFALIEKGKGDGAAGEAA